MDVLADLNDLDLSEAELEDLSPALRAAISRAAAVSPETAEGPGGFNSFVDADL